MIEELMNFLQCFHKIHLCLLIVVIRIHSFMTNFFNFHYLIMYTLKNLNCFYLFYFTQNLNFYIFNRVFYLNTFKKSNIKYIFKLKELIIIYISMLSE